MATVAFDYLYFTEGIIISVTSHRSTSYLLCLSALLTGAMGDAYALGVGNIRVQSALGQQLRAQLDVTGNDAQDIDVGCFRATVESAEGILLSTVDLRVSQQGGIKFLNLSTRKNIFEPAVKVILNISCDAQLHREYLILLDPTELAPSYIKLPIAGTELDRTSVARRVIAEDPSSAVQKQAANQRRSISTDNTTVALSQIKKEKIANKSANVTRPRDALKLAGEVDVRPSGLKLESVLSAENTNTNAERSAELRLAQAQFAALLRGEAAPASAPQKTVAAEPKNQLSEQESVQLKRQILRAKASMEELRESSVPKEWFYALLALILGAVAVVGLLISYIRRSHKKTSSTWWEQKEAKPVVESRPNIEELVNSVQASYGNTGNRETLSATVAGGTNGNVSQSIAPNLKPVGERSLGNMDAPSIFGRNYTPSLEDTNSSTFNFFSTKTNSVKVEEISDVTQEAEFWMSVNDPERAIEILEPQAELDHPDSPVPWLYLLDLYRVVGNKEKYDPLRDRFVVFFNANVPEFEVDPATLPSRHLDDFEHLSKKICSLWNTNDILPFLESLLIDDRDGKRMGFELPVYRDILLLISIANELERQKTLSGAGRGWNAVLPPQAVTEALPPVADDGNMINFETIEFPKKSDVS